MGPPYVNSSPKGFLTTLHRVVLHHCRECPGPQLPVLMLMPMPFGATIPGKATDIELARQSEFEVRARI